MACQVIDRAIQAYGAEGVSQDTPLAAMYAGLRTLRIADVRCICRWYSSRCSSLTRCSQGPDAVHIQQIGQRELKRASQLVKRQEAIRQKEKAVAERYKVKVHL